MPSYRVAAELLPAGLAARRDRSSASARTAAITAPRSKAAHGLARLAVFFGVVDIDEAERAAVRGRELAELLGDRERLAVAHLLHGILTIMRPDAPDFAGGLALAERGVALAEAGGLHELALGLSRGLCTNYAADGRFALARERIERVLAELERDGHRERVSDVYLSARWVRDLVLYAQDEFDAGPRERGRDLRAGGAGEQPHHAERARQPAGARALPPRRVRRGASAGPTSTLEIGEAIANENAYTTGAAIALASRAASSARRSIPRPTSSASRPACAPAAPCS